MMAIEPSDTENVGFFLLIGMITFQPHNEWLKISVMGQSEKSENSERGETQIVNPNQLPSGRLRHIIGKSVSMNLFLKPLIKVTLISKYRLSLMRFSCSQTEINWCAPEFHTPLSLNALRSHATNFYKLSNDIKL